MEGLLEPGLLNDLRIVKSNSLLLRYVKPGVFFGRILVV